MTTATDPVLLRQQRWNQRLIGFCLIYTIFSGAIRKWLVSGTLLSDVMLLGHIVLPWIFYFTAAGSRRKYAPLMLVFGGILVLMAFNPLNQTIYHGALGVFLHLGFWLVGFHYLENRHLYRWDALTGLLIFIFLAEMALGIVQYNLSRTHVINRYAAEWATSIAYVGEAARVTGTFSFVSGFTSWLFFVSLGLYAMAVRGVSVLWITVLTGLTVVANLISGARGALAFTAVFALLMYGHLFRRYSLPKLTGIFLLALVMTIALFRENTFIQNAWGNFYSRIEDGIRDNEYGRRTYGIVEELVNYRGENALFGSGLGGTYQGARLLWGESYFLQLYGGYEEETERIVLEGGFFLFFLRTALLVFFLAEFKFSSGLKILFGIIIALFTHSIFNVYNIIFVPWGLSLLEWAFLESASEKR